MFDPSSGEFLPSTLEHRPLKAVEKKMLIQHFETTGMEEVGTFTHWHHADSAELQALEGWVWGMRYWGRETLFRIALYAYKHCRLLWDVGDENESSDVKKVKMGPGGTPLALLELCMKWAKLPGEAVAMKIYETRGEDPESWIQSEIAPEDQTSVYAFTLIALHRMASTTLEPRDIAATMASQAMVCSARALESAGRSKPEAIAEARRFVINEMRKWFGRKW